jgi:hypothetical protein
MNSLKSGMNTWLHELAKWRQGRQGEGMQGGDGMGAESEIGHKGGMGGCTRVHKGVGNWEQGRGREVGESGEEVLTM